MGVGAHKGMPEDKKPATLSEKLETLPIKSPLQPFYFPPFIKLP